jgi:hypothetical protein
MPFGEGRKDREEREAQRQGPWRMVLQRPQKAEGRHGKKASSPARAKATGPKRWRARPPIQCLPNLDL